LTGSGFRWFIVPVALAVLLLLWFGTFGSIEDGVSMLGLITLCFLVAAWKLHPSLREIAHGFVPTAPHHDKASYGFIAVSILGATISPYMLNFYSSGAVEEKWSRKDLTSNRLVAAFGMGFGAIVSLAVLATAAMTLAPEQIRVDNYHQAALMLVSPFGRWGVTLFALSLLIGCFGAALEIALNFAYLLAQAFGWTWGEDHRPDDDARFCVAYCVVIALAAIVALSGIGPLKLTLLAMALSVIVMPIVVFPFLVLMNDERYVGQDKNGWIGNTVVLFTLIMGFVVALIAIPLEFLGS
jgi:Mn2+/Fe2+ NRAMP family transporter